MAENWKKDDFEVLDPVLAGVKITADVFGDWIRSKGFRQPNFWALPNCNRGSRRRNVSNPTCNLNSISAAGSNRPRF